MGSQMVGRDWATKHTRLSLTRIISSPCSGAYRAAIVTVLCPFLLIFITCINAGSVLVLAFSPHCGGVFSCFSMLSNFGGKPGIVIFTLDSEYYSIPVNTLELCSVPWLRSSETV